jgi:7-cyano-7-deazaguanine synthase
MSIVNLVSGGLDSTLIGVLAKEQGIETFPLFIDYGQLAREREWVACQRVHKLMGLETPMRMDLSGYGQLITSGLTSNQFNINTDAFTPGRNFMFLVMGCSYAYRMNATSVTIGLLSEKFSLFPDQRPDFIQQAEIAIWTALGTKIKVVTPLSDFSKADVIALAQTKGISNTYSCHAGNEDPCNQCISCLEIIS